MSYFLAGRERKRNLWKNMHLGLFCFDFLKLDVELLSWSSLFSTHFYTFTENTNIKHVFFCARSRFFIYLIHSVVLPGFSNYTSLHITKKTAI